MLRLPKLFVTLLTSILVLSVSATLVYSSDNLKPLLVTVIDCATSGQCLRASNTGTGIALYGVASSNSGSVRGYTGSSSTGVYGRSTQGTGTRGQGGTSSGDYGGYFTGFEGARGIASGSNGYGTWGTASGGNGIGAYGSSSGTSGFGVYGYSSQYIGVRGYSNGTAGTDYGGYFTSNNGRGLYADGGSGWFDGYFPNCIGVGGTSYGSCSTLASSDNASTGMSMMAINQGNEALAPGDVVVFGGISSADGSTPVLLVRKADGASGSAVVGVVQSAYALEEMAKQEVALEAKVDVLPETEAVPGEEADGSPAGFEAAIPPLDVDSRSGRFVAGDAAPGQHLLVLVQGIAKVNVDASSGSIQAGDSLSVAGAGRAAKNANGAMVVGRALESIDQGAGSIYVLVGVR